MVKRDASLDEPLWRQLAREALARCDAIAACSDDSGRITRLYCSPALARAHKTARPWFDELDMAPRVDAAANLAGCYYAAGADRGKKLLLASHLDSVIDAGRYDGVLGVVIGLAVVAALRARGAKLPWGVAVIGFSDEEGVRFGTPFLGSHAVAGSFEPALLARRDAQGVTVADALREFGCDPTGIPGCAPHPGESEIVAYLEAHIEQGPALELGGLPLAVVDAIAGQSRLSFTFRGSGGHAGTVPMRDRRDPLIAGSRWAVEVSRRGAATLGLTATVGHAAIDPNVPNCIPRTVTMSLDVRHANDAVRRAEAAELIEIAEAIAREERVAIGIEQHHDHGAIAMDAEWNARLDAASTNLGLQCTTLTSGAGHDAGVMARVAPSAMLLIRSPGGVSHDPAEAVTEPDVAAAIAALTLAIEEFAAAKSS
ncbi:MAG: Zn-dependent hydrolase [Planctomycetaceae bacterium]|nr:Zn-dependent hydrolase [Planctomycetaceae bacterium]